MESVGTSDRSDMARARALLRTAVAAQLVCSRYLQVGISNGKIVQFNLSDIGEGIREVTVKNWFVKEDDVVSQFDDICEVESDKATVSITSRFDGKVTKLYHQIGDKAFVGKPLVDIDVPGDGEEETCKSEVDSSANEEKEKDIVKKVVYTETDECLEDPYSDRNWKKSLATPAVRRIAMENKINIKDVRGTGKHRRVVKEDILDYLDKHRGVGAQITSVQPITAVQKVMTRTMTESLKIPQFLLCDEMDVSNLVRLRADVKEAAVKKNIKLTYLPFIIKAISKGLLEFPIMNSTFDLDREQITFKHFHNIGVAMDSPGGLLVPNIKNVQKLNILDIAKELNRLQDLASKMKLPPADFAGGTFSVSNIGIIAGTSATPLVLPPEVSIVALGRIRQFPRFSASGEVFPANILTVSWSADHRILDGATVAKCSEVVRYYVENPSALLLDL